MTTLVTIQYPTGSTFTQVMAVIQFSDAELQIGGSNNLVLNGTFTFSQMTVLSNDTQFQNNAAGSAVAGSVAIPVVPTGSNPSVMGPISPDRDR